MGRCYYLAIDGRLSCFGCTR